MPQSAPWGDSLPVDFGRGIGVRSASGAMALSITLNPARILTPRSVSKGDPIAADEIAGNVDVRISEAGCYGFDLELWQHFLTHPDVRIAHQRGKRKCHCFAAGQGRRFNYHGAGTPAHAPTDVDNGAGNPELEPLHGSWPTDSGAFDNTLLLYLRARVYRCPRRSCDSDSDCGELAIDQHETPIAEERTSDYRIEIADGEGFQRGIELIFSIVSLVKGIAGAAGAIPGLFARLESLEDQVAQFDRDPQSLRDQ